VVMPGHICSRKKSTCSMLKLSSREMGGPSSLSSIMSPNVLSSVMCSSSPRIVYSIGSLFGSACTTVRAAIRDAMSCIVKASSLLSSAGSFFSVPAKASSASLFFK